MQIGFIGLGVMGAPMARNLASAGTYRVIGFDTDRSKIAALEDSGMHPANSMIEAVENADLVMTSLPGPVQVKQVAFELGLLEHMPTHSTWIDLSTNNLSTCEKIRVAAQKNNIGYLDAPVSGGDEGARAGSLTILVGGDETLYARNLPVLQIIGSNITHLGPNGAGYSAKIAQVILCYLHSLALSEAMILGVKGGVDPAQMLAIIQNSTGKSYVADRYGPPIIAGDYDPSFTIGLALKDMTLAMEMAEDLGISLPMCNLTTETYAKAVEVYGFDANHLKTVRLLEEQTETFLQV